MGNTAAYRGGGFMNLSCTTTLTFCTFARNRCTVSSSSATGGGILAYSGASVTGNYNIVWDNSSYTNPNIGGTANFTYSDVQGGLAGTGNINADPLFVHNPPRFFCLSQTAAGQSQNSPCINLGSATPPTGSTRTDGVQDASPADAGLHWPVVMDQANPWLRDLLGDPGSNRPVEGTIVPQSMDLRLDNHPNPFNPATTVTLWLDQAAPVDLAVYSASGELVQRLFQGNLDAGSHNFLFSGSSLPTGVYLYRADCAGRIVTGKALLVK